MNTKYGFTLEQWENAKEEIRNILINVARTEGRITYSDLAARVTSISLQAWSYALAALLGEISKEEDLAGRGMLSVIVVHKEDKKPGHGFFSLAKDLGRDISDKEKFWIDEDKRVREY